MTESEKIDNVLDSPHFAADVAGHTPGPWRVDYNPDGSNMEIVTYPNDTRRLIVAMPGGNAGDRENSLLIAAAPQLLAALHEVVESPGFGDAIEPGQSPDLDGGPVNMTHFGQATINTIRAAIAAANTGATQ